MFKDENYKYVRNVEVVGHGQVMFLGSDEMNRMGYNRSVFASDCTFKTVETGWYLSNIVAPHSITTSSSKTVVVARLLLSSLHKESYACDWKQLLTKLKTQKAKDLCLQYNDVSIRVDYIPTEEHVRHNSVHIRNITVDFEQAQIQGI